MSAAKHTPGPWAVRRVNRACIHIVGPRGGLIATVTAHNDARDVAGNQMSDAFVLAAARDMLHALQEIEEWECLEHAPVHVRATVRAAIAKATGEQP